jgi:hypothetical protein
MKKPLASGLPALFRAEPVPGTYRGRDKEQERNMCKAGSELFPVLTGRPVRRWRSTPAEAARGAFR